MTLLEILSSLEENDEIHQARLLILLAAFGEEEKPGMIEGLTKLAKLDFLLRYPVYLERALLAKKKTLRNLAIGEHERRSVESKMVRYRFGPWDFRYRRFINLLVGQGLASVNINGRTIEVSLTKTGQNVARKLEKDTFFADIARRAAIIRANFNMKGTDLMRFVYQTFPEIGSLNMGEEINS
jgi:hypothetical protein